ncbi:hypothetical protein TOPH_08834 [Tolypocladium ophioglossoides CBS 100239]|uniref:Transcription factor hoxa13 n=1 Tax=Tolypocladium ophioglossoides (strain CBS 100239) TaxID=1163406 RepID=A0A0L0MXC6_TOLOC|nr:hypothetical protein TOPH_08834 [Tolypocladium ophioglossoides CBS 100239]
MAQSSGSIKPGNGSVIVNGKLSGQPAVRRRTAKQRRGFFAWALSLVARLATWAAIFTVLFRCPSSLEACDETSPFICQHYFRAKNAVSPHVEPYYDQYAAPYVDVAKPYYDAVNSRVLTPSRVYVVQYGAPWVKKGQDYVWSQWEANGQPQLARLRQASQAQYDQSIAPHLTKAGDAIGPYYDIARTNSLQLFYEYALPSYEFVRPYAAQGYDAASGFATGTALPASYWAWNKANNFLDTAVWPQLRAVYVENVEPQLVRIGERLGRYKNQAKTKVLPVRPSSDGNTISETVQSSFSKPSPQSSTMASTTVEESATSVADATKPQETGGEYWNPVEAPPAAENESEKRRKAREMVAQDLELWQNKFAAQADEGATDIEDRVDEIARLMIEENAKVTGKGLVEQLEATIESELADLRTKISSTVADGSDGAEDKAVNAIRSAGVAIKKRAQVIRGWREDYDAELQETVVGAADVHFQILDETRGLALQQIGMRWAWTDGVTYKDWAKYHELKSTLTQWTEELKQLVVSHPTLLEAQDASAQVEDEGMTIASAAAKELARLKQVAHWKILAKDSTDSFDSEEMQLAAEAAEAAQKAAQKEPEVEETVAEHVDEAESVLKDAAEQGSFSAEEISSAVEETVLETVSAVTEAAAEATSSVVDAASEAKLAVEDQISAAGGAASSVVLDTVEEAVSSSTGAAEPIILGAAEEVPEDAEPTTSLAAEASEAPKAKPAAVPEDIGQDGAVSAEDDSDDTKEASESGEEKSRATDTTTVHSAMFGAVAQSVSDRRPVLDDYVDSDMIGSATAAAQAAYSSAVSLASDRYLSAVSVVSAQIHGTPKPVHEQLFSSVSAAYGNAVAGASRKLHEAVEAASTGVYGKPTPTSGSEPLNWEKVESIAAQRLNEGRLWAEIQYQSALIALGVATPTPTSPTEKFVNQAKVNYYAGLGLAQDRYMSFISAASAAWSSVTATPTPTDFVGSASSVASVASESASSVAHAAGDAAHSAYSAATEGVFSAAEAVEDTLSAAADAAGEQIYIAGVAIAETWDNVVSELSARVYGEPTAIGWCDSVIESAGSYASAATRTAHDAASTATPNAVKQYEAVSEIVSELVSGKEPAFSESVLSRLSAVYATAAASVGSLASEASAAAASVGDKVGSAASHATDAVKDSVQHEKDEL